MSLVPRPSVTVRFSGTRSAEGPLNIGQYNILQWLRGESEQFFAAVAGELDVPAAAVVDDVAGALAVLVERHEGLRTTYVDGVEPQQFVHATGDLVVEVYAIEAADPQLVDRAGLARDLTRRLRAAGPYRIGELPVRAALAVLPGDASTSSASVVQAAVIGCSHLAVDYQAMEIIKREFADLIRDRAARPTGGPPIQPLDLVALERTPKALRHEESVLSYWKDRLSRMPQCLYPVPRVAAGNGSVAVELTSTAAGMALRAVTARTRTSRASVVLAAIGAVLSHRTGTRELVLPTLSANRFEPHLRQHVGSLAQLALITLTISDTTFDRLVRQAWAAVVDASRHGRYDVDRQRAVAGRVEHERGIMFDCEPLFNNLVIESGPAPGRATAPVPTPGELDAARRTTQLRRQPMPVGTTLIRFDLYGTDGQLRLGCWSSDTGRISDDEVESLLMAVENLLIAAGSGDLDARGIRGAIPLGPVQRGPGWLLVDGCWVEVAEVQRLLDDELAATGARVFAAVNGLPLVACLARTETVRTPEQAHAACMTALKAYPTAMTPQHYVICERVPDDPGDPAAWIDVCCQGSGRNGGTADTGLC
ncbi:condensation domain-containing protein [Micromonospora sp. NPDC051925]|uniref:condensation domain-containing protein n=1 Tax=Micromonospora sp. NPDC051925 TaxID=3364288 RepID=UPI0037C5816A